MRYQKSLAENWLITGTQGIMLHKAKANAFAMISQKLPRSIFLYVIKAEPGWLPILMLRP
jgi:hypothetical protein